MIYRALSLWLLTMIPDFQIPAAADRHDEKLLSDVRTFGWHVLRIFEDEDGPGFCFSVGLYYTFRHPEILVMGLPPDVGHELINLAGDYIAKGRVFQSRERTADLAQGFSCSFVPIAIEHYEQYLGYAIWFYRNLKAPFPALQLVWPDKGGRLPWDPDYDQDFERLQRLLNRTP